MPVLVWRIFRLVRLPVVWVVAGSVRPPSISGAVSVLLRLLLVLPLARCLAALRLLVKPSFGGVNDVDATSRRSVVGVSY